MDSYRLRQMDVDDKVCEQMDVALAEKISPKEVIERCVQETACRGTKPEFVLNPKP